MKTCTDSRRHVLTLCVVLSMVLSVAGFLVISLAGYYLRSIGSPHDPAAHGYTPTEVITEPAGGFVMNRYRIKEHWLERYLAGKPHQQRGDGYDTIIVITDLSGDMIARISHSNGNPKIAVTPAGITGTGGIKWKGVP
ncbi:MAG: hypothetical protein AAF226_07195 [Verrucomicrobiota bacterium]